MYLNSNATIGGIGGSGTITMLTVGSNSGRPSFGITRGTINMPTAKEINELIDAKLKDYVKIPNGGKFYLQRDNGNVDIINNLNTGQVTITGNATINGQPGSFTGNSTTSVVTGGTSVRSSTFYIKVN